MLEKRELPFQLLLQVQGRLGKGDGLPIRQVQSRLGKGDGLPIRQVQGRLGKGCDKKNGESADSPNQNFYCLIK